MDHGSLGVLILAIVVVLFEVRSFRREHTFRNRAKVTHHAHARKA